METDCLSAQNDELYFELGVYLQSFPALIGRQPTDGHACPAFRRSVVLELLAWLDHRYLAEGRTELGRGYLNGDAVVLVDSAGQTSHAVPDAHGRYVLDAPYWTWEISTPTADIDAENALLADANRLVPEPGEEFVTVDGCHLGFPAAIERDAVDGFTRPRFRRPVAEVIVAYLNDKFRYFMDGTDRAYWHDDSIIYIGHDDCLRLGSRPEVIKADEGGRYCFDRCEWLSPSTDPLGRGRP